MDSSGQTAGPPGESQGTGIPEWLLAFMRSQQETNMRLEQGIAQLQAATTTTGTPNSFTGPQAPVTAPASTPTTTTEGGKKPRHSQTHPDKFTGDDESDFPQFRGLLEAKLDIDRQAIGTERECVWYAYGRLAGTAAGRMYPWMDYTKNTETFTIQEFLGQLDAAFADPQKQGKALAQINRIRQGNRGFREFLREFEQTLLEAQGWRWEDQVRKGYLRAAINHELRDRLVTQEEPASYSDYVNQLRRISDNLQEIKAWDSRRIRTARPRAHPNMNPQAYQQAPVSEPMEWEPTHTVVTAAAATKRPSQGRQRAPKSTYEERQKWRESGACARCGDVKHWAANCHFAPYQP